MLRDAKGWIPPATLGSGSAQNPESTATFDSQHQAREIGLRVCVLDACRSTLLTATEKPRRISSSKLSGGYAQRVSTHTRLREHLRDR